MIEYFKLIIAQTPKILLGLALFCLGGIIAPDSLLSKVGILNIREYSKQWLAILFGLSVALLLSHTFFGLFPFIKGRINGWFIVHRGKIRLKNLTHEEKEMLSTYIEGDTMAQTFDCTDGAVLALENEHIIYRASELSKGFTDFPYNIQPWARQHLIKNPQFFLTL